MTAYYNENDPFAAAWLRELIKKNLIARGDVDERSIVNVVPSDLQGYIQCHFFAGIGGWSYALRLAEWPDYWPVWTGSCPCTPFSSAARGRNTKREHLWPEWFRLISAIKPSDVFGEQVAQCGGWFDEVCTGLESLDYQIGAAILPACSVGKDHKRRRIYFAGHANCDGKSTSRFHEETSGMQGSNSEPRNLERANGVSSNMAKMRGYGNAIVPQVAAEFVKAYLEAI